MPSESEPTGAILAMVAAFTALVTAAAAGATRFWEKRSVLRKTESEAELTSLTGWKDLSTTLQGRLERLEKSEADCHEKHDQLRNDISKLQRDHEDCLERHEQVSSDLEKLKTQLMK